MGCEGSPIEFEDVMPPELQNLRKYQAKIADQALREGKTATPYGGPLAPYPDQLMLQGANMMKGLGGYSPYQMPAFMMGGGGTGYDAGWGTGPGRGSGSGGQPPPIGPPGPPGSISVPPPQMAPQQAQGMPPTQGPPPGMPSMPPGMPPGMPQPGMGGMPPGMGMPGQSSGMGNQGLMALLQMMQSRGGMPNYGTSRR